MLTNLFLRPVLIFFFSLLTSIAFSQNGALKGNIADENGNPLMDVNVVIPKLNKGAVTDWEGNYYIGGIPTGLYTIYLNVIGYKADTIRNFPIAAGEPTNLIRTLKPESQGKEVDLGDFAVIGTKQTETEQAVIQEIKEAEQVVTGISAEQISKGQDRSAAQVMTRIPGVTLIENRFVMVRGLSQRYNSVMINGMISPSTEPDSRAFSFDIIQSGLLDRMLVYKSGSADLPADFAGAVIKVYTKANVEENFTRLGFTAGYRPTTTFKTFRMHDRNFKDHIGFGGNQHQLQEDFPTNLRTVNNRQDRVNASKQLPNNWGINESNAYPDIRFNYSMGRKFNLGTARISNITGINYSNTNLYYKQEIYRYENYAADNSSLTRHQYEDDVYRNSVNLGLLHNWSAVLSPSHKIQFLNMYNRLGVNEFLFREGERLIHYYEDRNYSMRRLNRGIYLGQLRGEHNFTKLNTDFVWMFGYANTNRMEPDWKRATSRRTLGSDDDFKVTIPPSATIFDAARFYSDLKEKTYSASGNFTYSFKPKSDTVKPRTKILYGYYLETKDRSYQARWLAYVKANTNFYQPINDQPLDQIFSNNNIFIYPNNGVDSSGLILEEGTNPTDKYFSNNSLMAGYLGFSTSFLKRINFSTGARYEQFRQNLRIEENGSDTVNWVTNDILPFGNLSFNFSEKTLVRFAYSKTLNRPEVRELAPFSFYDFQFAWNVVGNPNLLPASIHNLDLRFEWYPSGGEFVSLGVFYKRFNNPIEYYILRGQESPIFTLGNADKATSQGVELEIRKSLNTIFEKGVLSNLGILINTALIQSKVYLGSNSVAQASERALQGQSPYVVNAGLYYNNDENGWQGSLLYNVYGKRIFSVGDIETRTIYEMPRNTLDFSISKVIKRFEYKFGIVNILNPAFQLREDGNNDTRINSDQVDKIIQTYKTGQYFTLGISYKF